MRIRAAQALAHPAGPASSAHGDPSCSAPRPGIRPILASGGAADRRRARSFAAAGRDGRAAVQPPRSAERWRDTTIDARRRRVAQRPHRRSRPRRARGGRSTCWRRSRSRCWSRGRVNEPTALGLGAATRPGWSWCSGMGAGCPCRRRRRPGWWSTAAELPSGTDYLFGSTAATRCPDPRSTRGSRMACTAVALVDPAAFRGRTPVAAAGPRRRGRLRAARRHVQPEGTFDGAIERLDHLVELGVTHIELMPVAEFPGERGWGYDGVDLFAPHQPTAARRASKRLVDAAHAAASRCSSTSSTTTSGRRATTSASSGRTSPTATRRPGARRSTSTGRGSDEVRRFFIDNALMWLRDYHVDGLRLDAVHAIVDTSAIHFLEQLATEVAELAPRRSAVADADRRERPQRPAARAPRTRRLRARRPVERRLPPRPAHRS